MKVRPNLKYQGVVEFKTKVGDWESLKEVWGFLVEEFKIDDMYKLAGSVAG